MNNQIVVSAKSLVERLFQFSSVEEYAHKQFVEQMIAGIIGSQSTLLSNIGRFLNEKCRLKHTVKRLGRMLNNLRIPLQELQVRMLELASFRVQDDAVIAFDPGDIYKKYARKMDGLYKVWDGSEKKVNNGYDGSTPDRDLTSLPLLCKQRIGLGDIKRELWDYLSDRSKNKRLVGLFKLFQESYFDKFSNPIVPKFQILHGFEVFNQMLVRV